MAPLWPGSPAGWAPNCLPCVRVALHCKCGLSFEGEILSAAQAFTTAWWKVHCGPGHGPSPVHVERPTEAEVLKAYQDDIAKGGDA